MFFLVLMWPALYIRLMPTLLTQFTDATNRALAVVVSHLPMKVSLDPAQSGLIWVHQNGQPDIGVSVGSACSGANGVLGFALIGGALLTTASGARWRKLLWFAVGLALIFALNVLRLTSILGLAEAGQPSIALGAYHTVIGMVLFAIAIVVMMRGLPLFGLRSRGPVEARALEDRPAPAPSRPRPRWRKVVAIGGALLVVTFVGFANHELRPYAAFLDGTGAPTVKAFDLNTKAGAALPAGVSVKQSDGPFTWATQYFGANSTFVRYQVASSADGVVYADVVDTDDRGALDAYDIRTSRRIDLGSGVVGLLLNYSDPTTKAHWSTVSWAWPVLRDGQTFYERVALTADLSPGQEADFRPDGNPLHSFVIDLLNRTSGSAEDPSVNTMYASADAKLEGLAGRLVVTSVDAANR
jgi:exosortase/archaeosortase family protein